MDLKFPTVGVGQFAEGFAVATLGKSQTLSRSWRFRDFSFAWPAVSDSNNTSGPPN